MKQWFRLSRSTDIKRVRRSGRTYAHPLVMLMVEKSSLTESVRAGVIAGKSTGGAVTRNLIKRRIRAILDQESHRIQPGWNLIIVARKQSSLASFFEMKSALIDLFHRAHLIEDERSHVGKSSL